MTAGMVALPDMLGDILGSVVRRAVEGDDGWRYEAVIHGK